jgi:hypothetical protein
MSAAHLPAREPASAPHAARPPGYLPRRPAETVLYPIVRDHLEAFLAHARETYERGLPRYVEQAFRGYLECGIFAHGFLRFHCDGCRRDLLVAFACKGRGLCPSCAARRMCNSAAHLVDRVLSAVPVRQWVLSLPWELRRLAAFRAPVARALGRIFIDVIALEQRREAGIAESQHAAIDHLQRFGGSLNLNLHFHAIVADGVFAPDPEGKIRFHPLAPPSPEILERVVRRIRDRVLLWLRRKGHLDERPAEERSNEPAEQSAIDACAELASRGGLFVSLDHGGADSADDGHGRFEPRRRGPFTAELDGFNVQAAVRIEASDDEGRERLVRYCARPSFALDRLSVLPDGRVAYRVKYPGRRSTHRVMTPLELLARLAALVAPPRFPLLRYHGVLAPHAKWRHLVVPRSPKGGLAHSHRPRLANDTATTGMDRGFAPAKAGSKVKPNREAPKGAPIDLPSGVKPATPAGSLAGAAGAARARAAPEALPAATAGTSRTSPAASVLAGSVAITDFGISVRHLDRLLGGLLMATSPRLPWAQLLRRTYATDVLGCTGCGGRLRLMSAITSRPVARRILEHLGLPAEEVAPRPRSRDPAES